MRAIAKKFISFILLVVLLASMSAPLLVVGAASEHDNHLDPEKELPTMQENLIQYTCRYDEKNDKILISGTVHHDVMIGHRDYTIEVYSIAPDQTINNMTFFSNSESKASMEIAIKFDFSISAPTVTDRFSRYAVILRSPDGDMVLASEPQYIHVASSYQYSASEEISYKGISSELTSLAGSVTPGTAIIPVYFNRLLSDNTGGMVYKLEDLIFYFDSAYLEELDVKARTYDASGAKVYFQFLLETGASEETQSKLAMANGFADNAEYDFPDLRKKENLQKIAAASAFLAERYNGKQNALLSGLVVGSSIDRQMKNYTGGLSTEEYAEQYAFYLLVVSNAARIKNAALDVLIPFSDVDTYSVPLDEHKHLIEVGDYSPSVLLEGIVSVLENRLNGKFSCGTMIESSVLPLIWSNAENKWIEDDTLDHVLAPKALYGYETYLNGLQKASDKAPSHFVYSWNAPSSMEENSLSCSYVYTYYYLLRYKTLSSFVVDFDEGMTKEAFSNLVQILRYIDTEKGTSITEPLLSYFKEKRWEDVLKIQTLSVPDVRNVYRVPSNAQNPSGFTGSFEYFDFSSATSDGWYSGFGCTKLKNDLWDNVRGIHGVMANTQGKGASEILCLYEFSENFVYTPYLKLTVEIPTEAEIEALYEVTVSLGNDRSMILTEQFVPSGKRCEIWLDLRNVRSEDLMTKSIKIGVEPVEGETEEFSLWVLGMTGYSQTYTSEELSDLIREERLRIRNENAEQSDNNKTANLLWIIFGTLFLVSSVVVGIVLFFRHHDESEEEAEQEAGSRNPRDKS